jgi:hypothetical protein
MQEEGHNRQWKELLRACSQNNIDLVRYHLDNNVDPNYQHPEHFTSPLFEAIHCDHWHVCTMLVDAGASLNCVDISSGLRPLELALALRRHTIVDFLLDRMPEKLKGAVMTILVSGRVDKQFLQRLTATGHIIMIDDDTSDPGLVQNLQVTTNNRKVKLTNMISSDLVNVTHWIVRESGDMLQYMMDYAPIMRNMRRSLIIAQDRTPSTELFWLLPRNSKTTAVVEPTAWWETIGDFDWSNKWQQTVWWLLCAHDPIEGCLYDYQRKVVADYNNNNNSPGQVEGWNAKFKDLVTIGRVTEHWEI